MEGRDKITLKTKDTENVESYDQKKKYEKRWIKGRTRKERLEKASEKKALEGENIDKRERNIESRWRVTIDRRNYGKKRENMEKE